MPAKPVTLIILDGWGVAPPGPHNAISQANTPNWDRLLKQYPHSELNCAGLSVGLPDGQMGNSEVGHLHIGAGRVLFQDFTRINQAIDSGDFFNNEVFANALNTAQAGATVHIAGLLSPGGVHSHENHIIAMAKMAAQQQLAVVVHAFLDGRDTPPQSATDSISLLEQELAKLPNAKIASICGRFYAMDRDKRWERIQAAYDLITLGQAEYYSATANEALQQAYDRGETDEFVQASAIATDATAASKLKDSDIFIHMNFRADRARQLSYALTQPEFKEFNRKSTPKLAKFITLTKYANDLDADVAFGPEQPKNVLGEYAASHGLKQLRIAETEKYAHVSFFFNGGRETPFDGEDRELIPSPKVKTYDLQPEMSAPELTDKLVAAINSDNYDLIICNYANSDMVGHTGDFAATIKAVECIDTCLGKVINAIEQVGGAALVTSDHGNAEQLYDPETQQPHTAHTYNPVPLLYVGSEYQQLASGSLTDIAPSLIHILGLSIPSEMTGKNLLS